MKRQGGLWQRVVCWDNLLRAAQKARRGKRHRPVVVRFEFHQEWHLLRLQHELEEGSYRPGPFTTHWIDRPKRRLISAAPYRDRVVHHAVMNVLEPILDRSLHPDSYACRKGKGTHAAVNRLQQLMRRCRYALPCDVRKFFPSIDHALLKDSLCRLVKDVRLLCLLDLIVDCSNEQEAVQEWYPGDDLWSPLERRLGLPIGNLTSQWFANWFLNDLDHFLTSRLRVGGYVRYCDDFVLLDNDRVRLRVLRDEVVAFLAHKRLRLHEGKRAVVPVRASLTFVGYRIWPRYRVLPRENVHRFRRRLRWLRKAYAEGRIGGDTIRMRLASWVGHARQANSKRLLERLSRQWVFRRANFKPPCRVS
jgi:RNA-directed DNA polymerase